MATTDTTNIDLDKHAFRDTGWHTALNANFDAIDALFSAVVSKTVSATGDTSLSVSETLGHTIKLNGTITDDITVSLNRPGRWLIWNNTSGAFTVTVRDDSGDTGVEIQQGDKQQVVCDGTNAFLEEINADQLSSGTLAAARIPTLDASKIGTGELSADRIPALDASKVSTGTFTASQIPSLAASKITSGELDLARIPTITNAKIDTVAWSKITSVPSSTSADANTLALRTSSGYLLAAYFYQSSSNNENPGISQFMVTNGSDHYLRKASAQHVANTLDGLMTINWSQLAGEPNVNAGNGLTGGGSISGSVTLNIGTPGSITGSSTNSVSSASHTHNLSINETAVSKVTHPHPSSQAVYAGHYVFARVSGTAQYECGDTVSGTILQFADAGGNVYSSFNLGSGTFVCCGYVLPSGSGQQRTTLWRRVS